MDFNFGTLAILVTVNGVVFVPTYRRLPKDTFSIYYLLIAVSTFIYSGLGMCYEKIGTDYLVKYCVFFTVYLLTMYFCRMVRFKKRSQSINNLKSKPSVDELHPLHIRTNQYGIFNSTTVTVMTILFFFTYLVFLIVPENRLYMIFQPPLSTVIGGYDRIKSANENSILDLAITIRSVCIPFFMLTLKKMFDKKKRLQITLLMIFWIYMQFLSQMYIGRSELLVFAIFLLILLFSKNDFSSFYISRKMLVIASVLIIIAIPALLSYQYSRQGTEFQTTSYSEAFNALAKIELFFPQYYPQLSIIGTLISPMRYLLWFLLLPIPSIILPSKGILTVQINRVFSSEILGVSYGIAGYTGLLPSIFGESILIYGESFYFIHAIMLGILVYVLYKLLTKHHELDIINLYFAINSISIARGGSQGFFGMAINSLVFYMLICFIKNVSKK